MMQALAPKPIRRVLIGTPAHDGKVVVEYVHSIIRTARLLGKAGIAMRETFVIGNALVQDARNELVRLALKGNDQMPGGFDDLVFIDSDQDWQPEWVPQLLSYPVDVVGAPVIMKADTERYNVRAPTCHLEEGPEIEDGSGKARRLLAVETLGTGFIRFSRRALQALWDASEPYRADDWSEARWIFDTRPVNGHLVGEDNMVSYKLARAGIKVWIDPTMTCGHIGRRHWRGDFAAWLERLKAIDKAKRDAA